MRFERSAFGWSAAASIIKSETIYHFTTTDGEVSVIGIDNGGLTDYKEFESAFDAVKFLKSAIDKS
jgi:hypothetical protein